MSAGDKKVILEPIYVMGTPMRPVEMEVSEVLGLNLHRIYLEDTGTGFTDNLVLNADGDGESDWDVSGATQVGDYWTLCDTLPIWGYTMTPSIGNGTNGFTNRFQQADRSIASYGIISFVSNDFGISDASGKTYELRFTYRAKYGISVVQIVNTGDYGRCYSSSNTIIVRPSNTGDAIEVYTTWVSTNNNFMGISLSSTVAPESNNSDWIQIDKITVREVLK